MLAEHTLPSNEGDITYFRPLYHQSALALDHFPTHITADAAYDAWYVYDAVARRGGIAAVPRGVRSTTPFDPDGTPRCPIGLRMHSTFHYAHTKRVSTQGLCLAQRITFFDRPSPVPHLS
ncbi:hypothetical protein KSF_099620 [Reticulibacter mediterranei]|uniref:Uncharacterized protein n=1 Tax=Reticulibacter mediterranei TaxID=2778369 RepID=A0A8J3IQ66_9CHLR|nr:hypothetical protein [Reticulibacter mediterranei]GHO99914.1 hypothetical protein KSF_099620 [Reticulibacter mediterranei]